MTTGSAVRQRPHAGIGQSAARPDAQAKVLGQFAFSSDLHADRMLWAHILRSPYPHAVIKSIDIGPALAVPGVAAVLTAGDVPGSPLFGLERADQPVFAADTVRFHGEPVAAVAADHPAVARKAAEAVLVSYEPMRPLLDPEAAIAADPIHPDGNIFHHLTISHGDPSAAGPVVVEGYYEVGMQDQAFMGPESGLAIPDDDGGVDLYLSTQYLHGDRDQIATCLGLPAEKVRLVLAGVGGAFGAREDISMQIHLCMLALHTGKPVKIVFSREESFLGHVHRHPARMWFSHHATADGQLVKVAARLVLDGGAYASTSGLVLGNAASFSAGPYAVPNAHVEGWAARTNNPPCGAMRGFGAVQVCFAYESQMDRLASKLSLSPVEVRLRNSMQTGDRLITGQVVHGVAPVAELIRTCSATPMPAMDPSPGFLALPGGSGRTASTSRIQRGVGFAVGFKNLMYSGGFDDFSTARIRLEGRVAEVTCAAAEVGQGFVTIAQQIVREVLDVDDVVLAPAATARIGSAGSSSASRQTWMSGGAIYGAALAVQRRLDAGERGVIEETFEHHHRPTAPLGERGQGNAHLAFAFAAHRAVVDVDLDLGLVRVVEIATSQDVGRVLNPIQVVGQIEGGIAQGVGLAVMEEVLVTNGVVRNASFTDYLIPTALDMPEVRIAALIEQPEPGAPFGAKGVGEAPAISSSAAVAAAVRDATGLDLTRIPIKPEDIALAHLAR
jgi:CO/xanthine dehydrogenase Mo-binding subunit